MYLGILPPAPVAGPQWTPQFYHEVQASST